MQKGGRRQSSLGMQRCIKKKFANARRREIADENRSYDEADRPNKIRNRRYQRNRCRGVSKRVSDDALASRFVRARIVHDSARIWSASKERERDGTRDRLAETQAKEIGRERRSEDKRLAFFFRYEVVAFRRRRRRFVSKRR